MSDPKTTAPETDLFTGRFSEILGDAAIPPLPEGVARILEEINSPDTDIALLENLIAAEPEISFRIMAMVNSSLFALRCDITSIRHALAMLGFDRVRSIVVANAMLESLPKPENAGYRHEVFWTDSLLRALLAKSLAGRSRIRNEETAFTAALVADVALPVLLTEWAESYAPIISEWRRHSRRLAEVERDSLKWDHAQAGAWILNYWSFPRELVAISGGHNLSPGGLRDHGLMNTPAVCVATAALLPSCAHLQRKRCIQMVETAFCLQDTGFEDWPAIMEEVTKSYTSIHAQFGLTSGLADPIFQMMEDIYRKGQIQLCLNRLSK